MFCVVNILYKFFVCMEKIIKMPEAIDWIIKYFILHSIILFDFLWGILKIPQKARVFISKVIQTIIQEFLEIQSRGVIRVVVIIKLFVFLGTLELSSESP